MRRLSLICLLVACVAACNLAPRDSYEAGAPWPDAGGDLTGDASGPSVTVLWDRPFGLEGERLVELTAGKAGRYLAVTDSAIYLLDDAARQISRSPHPTGAGGARAKIQAAHWDGAGLGLTMLWRGATAWTWSLALTSSGGPFSSSALVDMPTAQKGAWGALTGGKVHATFSFSAVGMSPWYSLRRQERGKAATTVRLTPNPGVGVESVGDWAALPGMGNAGLGLCAHGVGGKVYLLQVGANNTLTPTTVYDSKPPAVGSCRLTGSGRSALVTYNLQGLPYAQLDLGPGAPDMGVKGVSYPVPTARVISATGGAASTPLRLSHKGYMSRVEDLLWDGSRYMALVLASGRGGRLMITALGEAGGLLARDILIPLSYEPGLLLGARLVSDATGYALLYVSRRPWDEGVLHMARFTVRW